MTVNFSESMLSQGSQQAIVQQAMRRLHAKVVPHEIVGHAYAYSVAAKGTEIQKPFFLVVPEDNHFVLQCLFKDEIPSLGDFKYLINLSGALAGYGHAQRIVGNHSLEEIAIELEQVKSMRELTSLVRGELSRPDFESLLGEEVPEHQLNTAKSIVFNGARLFDMVEDFYLDIYDAVKAGGIGFTLQNLEALLLDGKPFKIAPISTKSPN